MTKHANIRVFVAHATDDEAFVHGYLVHALGLPEHEVMLSSELAPGAEIVDEIARGALSPATIAVQSPAFMASPWSAFAERLALHHAVETGAGGSVVIPVLLADCERVLLSRFRVPLDFRNRARAHWDAEAARLRDCLGSTAPRVPAPTCPYPGARPFTAEDAGQFHARSTEIHALVESVRRGEREIMVVGPRGAGKSSLIAAGLVPRIVDREFAGERFAICAMRPGTDPAGELSKALQASRIAQGPISKGHDREILGAVNEILASQHGKTKLLLVVDQFEEIFTVASRRAREAFAALLDQVRHDPRVTLLLVVSADAYDRLLDSPLWPGPAITVSRIEVATPRGEALREAILQPASSVGVYCEPALIEQLLHDASIESRPLPRLQERLVELWEQRRYNLLCLQHDPASAGRRASAGRISPGLSRLARRVRLRSGSPHASSGDSLCTLDTSDRADDGDDQRGVIAWIRAGQDWWMLIAPLIVLALCGTVLRAC